MEAWKRRITGNRNTVVPPSPSPHTIVIFLVIPYMAPSMDDRVRLVSYYALSTVQVMKSSSIKTCYTASEYIFPNLVTVFVYGLVMSLAYVSPLPESTVHV